MGLPTGFTESVTAGLADGSVVPVLGPGALRGVAGSDGRPIPAESEQLILAMSGGKPLSPKLHYEFSRAAMSFELKRGRSFINKFLTQLYGATAWSRAPLHDWVAERRPGYVIDLNRDNQLQQSYAATPHTLVVGIARMGGSEYRFRLYHHDGEAYRAVSQEAVDPALPILFKPLGTAQPDPTFIASDADYVDYLTELMGGFAIPSFLKAHRKGRRYLLLGLRLDRDTERMMLKEIMYGAAEPAGWALLPSPKKNELRFCRQLGLEVIDADLSELVSSVPGLDLAAAS